MKKLGKNVSKKENDSTNKESIAKRLHNAIFGKYERSGRRSKLVSKKDLNKALDIIKKEVKNLDGYKTVSQEFKELGGTSYTIPSALSKSFDVNTMEDDNISKTLQNVGLKIKEIKKGGRSKTIQKKWTL